MHSIDTKAATKRVVDLIAIPGTSCQEAQVSEWIQQSLTDAGVPASAISTDGAHRKSPAGGEVGNLIVKLKGTVRGPRRLLMAHMDTVPLAVNSNPVIEGDTIRPKSRTTALGGDNRAGCAVVLTAITEILRQGLPHPPLTLLFTVQEEIGLRGARFLTPGKLGSPKLCFNWDGRDPASLIIAAVGATNLEIAVDGIASHAGAHPEDGVNAAVVASLALADLQNNSWHGLVTKGNRRGASNVGVVQGGAATNVVMPRVEIQAEVRSHNAAFRRKIVSEWKKAFERAVRSVSNASRGRGSLTFEEDTRYEAFKIPAKSECVLEGVHAVESLGLKPDVRSCDGGLDANWMSEHRFPAVTLGCGQYNIHTVDETLNIPEYLQACHVGLSLAVGGSSQS